MFALIRLSHSSFPAPCRYRGALFCKMYATSQPSENFYSFDEVTSTMDKAKEILAVSPHINRFAVLARSQTLGRGTRGRSWVSPSSNMHLTIAFRVTDVGIPLTLVPLRVGSLVCSAISELVTVKESVALKWPNDILIDNSKVCGILIEVENDFIVAGIGCNVYQAPPVLEVGSDAGRRATCIWEHYAHDDDLVDVDEEQKQLFIKKIGMKIFLSVSNWLDCKDDTKISVVDDFQGLMTKAPQRLRQTSGSIHEGTEVVPLRVNPDGSLEVKEIETGQIETLYTEYMW